MPPSLLLLALLAAPPPAWPFTAMTYNVLYEAPAADVARSLDVIAREKPDVVCLRELTPTFARAFRARLGRDYPHAVLAPRQGTWGVGIASRYPLSRSERFPERPHRLPALEADVRLGGRTLKVVCVHLMAPGARDGRTGDLLTQMEKNARLREQQARGLVERSAREQGPVLLLGDMNEGRQEAAMKHFAAAGFVHACDGPDAACGNTWPGATTALPAVVQIDHLLGRGLVFSGARVLREGGSDHFPVSARFDFQKEGGTPAPKGAPRRGH